MTTVHRAERRSIRLRDYDYAARGCYFVTICTQDKVCRFGTVVDDAMVHNPPGRMVHEALNEIGSWYPGADVDTWVVMPNHIHAIILLDDPLAVGPGPQDCPDPAGRRPRSDRPEPRRAIQVGDASPLSLADVVGRWKSLTTSRYISGVRAHGWLRFDGRLWQRNYYEHVIRDEIELEQTRAYIDANPLRWAHDRENPETARKGK